MGTIELKCGVYISSAASVAGAKEGQGPLGKRFDRVVDDALFGRDSWEMAEAAFVEESVSIALAKAGLAKDDLDMILAGDLQEQTTASTFGCIGFGAPFLGLFGACSTMGEGLGVGSLIISGGYAKNAAITASSHFCATEKLFRFPLEYGAQRTQAASWTATGAGAAVLCSETQDALARNGVNKDGRLVKITHYTPGRIVDMGIKDPANMGAAMAPAAADTILSHLENTRRTPDYYDVIATGDLGYIGRDLLIDLCMRRDVDLSKNLTDCGIELFSKNQDAHNGGSGCACSAITLAALFYNQLREGDIRRMLFVPTGALLSQTSAKQGRNIPAIAHAVAIESV